MPIGTCDPASRGEQWNAFDMQVNLGGGVIIRAWGEYGWDGVSTRETGGGCDGPLNSLNVSNSSATDSAYVLLPFKRRGDKWVEIPPGTNTSISPGQRNQIGVENWSDLWDMNLSLTPG